MIDKYTLRQFLWSWDRARDKSNYYNGSTTALAYIHKIMEKKYGDFDWNKFMDIFELPFEEWYFGFGDNDKSISLAQSLSKHFEIEVKQPLSANECRRPTWVKEK